MSLIFKKSLTLSCCEHLETNRTSASIPRVVMSTKKAIRNGCQASSRVILTKGLFEGFFVVFESHHIMRSVLLDPVCVRISFTYEGFGTSIKGLTPCGTVGGEKPILERRGSSFERL
jgi:hypothetical protein